MVQVRVLQEAAQKSSNSSVEDGQSVYETLIDFLHLGPILLMSMKVPYWMEKMI